jgi:hypothetical protein
VAEACGLPVQQLLACDLSIFCKLLTNLSKLLLWLGAGARKPRRHEDIVERLPQVAQILSQWPLNFRQLCASWHTHSGSAGAFFQTKFKWLFVYLYKNLRQQKHQTRFLLEQALAYAAQRWQGNPVKVTEPQLRRALAHRRYGSHIDAARILGWNTLTVERWIANGRLPATADGAGRRAHSVVDLDAVRQMKFSRHRVLKQREAARIVGVPYAVFRALVKNDIFQTHHVGTMRRAHTREDAEDFARALTRHARKVDDTSGLFSVGEFLNSNMPIERKVAVLRDILQGTLRVQSSGQAGLAALYVDTPLIQRQSRSPNGVMGVYEIIKAFDLSFVEARAIALTTGSFAQHQSRQFLRIDRHDVEAFLAQRTPLRWVAKKNGCNSRQLLPAIQRTCPHVLDQLPTGCQANDPQKEVQAVFVWKHSMAQVDRVIRELPLPRRRSRRRATGFDVHPSRRVA